MIRGLLALACLAGWISTAAAGQGVDVDVDAVPVETPVGDGVVLDADVEVRDVRQCITQRWESFIVEEPVTVMRKVRKWRLVDVPVMIDGPGPRPQDVVLQDVDVRTVNQVDCIQCQESRIDVDVRSTPSVPQPDCIGGQCVRRVIGNRIGAQGARVDIDVDTRPRGLFWRFRR